MLVHKLFLPFTVFVCLLVLIFSGQSPLTPDSYLHLGIGRFVIQKHHIPNHKDISYKEAQPSLEWISHSWLFDVLAYLSVSPNGTIGSWLLLCPVFLAVMYLLLKLFDLEQIPAVIQACFLILGSILLLSFWKVHPILMMSPLLLLTLYSFASWRKGSSQMILMLPIIFILWANLSGGYMMILSCVTLALTLWEFIGTKIWEKILKVKGLRSKGESKLLLGSVVVAVLASLLNPYGFRLYLYGVTGYALLGRAKWYSTLAGALDATNTGLFKTDLSPFYYVVFLGYFLVTLLGVIILLSRRKKKFFIQIYPYLPTAVFFWFGFFFIRFIPISAVLTFPLAASVLNHTIEGIKIRKTIELKKTALLLIPFLLLLLFWIWLRPKEIRFSPPREQCDFIKKNRIPPNILVSTEITGYIYYCLFPQKQQIDARDDFFDANDTIGIYGQLSTVTDDNIKGLVEDNEINVVLTGKENDYVTTYFGKKPNWSLVYLDYNGFLFVHNLQTSPELLKSKTLKYIDLTRNLGFDPKEIHNAIAELERFNSEYPNNALTTGQLASLYRFNNETLKAEITLKKIPESSWGFTQKTEMGRIQAAKGDCQSSEKYFKQALSDRNEQNVSKTVFDLAILYAGCFHDMTSAKHYFERYISYPLPDTERERATSIAEKFNITVDK